MSTIDDYERNAIQNFLIEVTLPIVATEGGQFFIIGTGTLFKVAGRLFLISAAHILDEYEPGRWAFVTSPHKGITMTFDKAEFARSTDPSVDICIAELKDERAKADLEAGWRILTLADVWLPDMSADCVYLCGFPSERAKYEAGNLRGRLFVVPTSFRTDIPNSARYSAEAVKRGLDFFLDYNNSVNELTGENVSKTRIQGTSGSSIWAYRKTPWKPSAVWSPQSSLRVIGVQSAYVQNDYLRAKSWGAVLIALASFDDQVRAEVSKVVDEIRSKTEPLKQ